MDLLKIYLEKYNIKESPDLVLKKHVQSFFKEKGVVISTDVISVFDGRVSLKVVGVVKSQVFILKDELLEYCVSKLENGVVNSVM